MAVHRHLGGPVPDAVAGGREERAVRHEPRIDRRARRDRHGEGTDADAAARGFGTRSRPALGHWSDVRWAPVLGRGLAGPVRRIRDGEPVAIGGVGLPGAGVEGRGQRAEGGRVALGDGTGVGLGDGIGLGLGLAVDTTAPGPPTTPVDLGMATATAPTATATAAAAPARTTNRDMAGLHAGRPKPARAWGIVRTAVEIARRVDDGSSAGPSSNQEATMTSGSRGALMPTGSPLFRGWNRSRPTLAGSASRDGVGT